MKFSLITLLLIFNGSIQATDFSCESQFTPIHLIQGSQSASKLLDEEVIVKGVVTGDFRGKERLGGFFVQQPQSDGNSKTSEGLFIQSNDAKRLIELGDLMLIKGRVSEQFDVTQLVSISAMKTCAKKVKLPAAHLLKMPLNGFNLEQVEGMRVGFNQPVVVTDLYPYLKYGELIVSSELLMAPTAMYRPGKAINKHSKYNKANRLTIDDGRNSQFPVPLPVGSDGVNEVNGLNPLAVGQMLNTVGVMHFAFGKYKLQPTEALQFSKLENQSAPSDPGGLVKIANFNLENYFTTIDQGEDICGPLKNFGCRGADSMDEYDRQLEKIVHVINQADASVVGLQELENNNISGLRLVEALNQAAGSKKWAYVDTGVLGEDVIKVGLIYQANEVSAIGEYALLNAKTNPKFKENKNRIVVVQTFKSKNNNLFNVATAHLKSKNCRDAEGDNKDQQDGQGCFNAVRVEVAQQISTWLNNDPTGERVEISILTGDLNAYQQEDPILVLQENGFENLADSYLNPSNWTTSFRGQLGSLDYVLVNSAAAKVATGLVQWHINSIHLRELDYNLEPWEEGGEIKPASFYQISPFASSDHDLVLAGFDL
ncbi:ExeM/NucH family extracellular endonuclease [Marinicella litoralis]|uniref:Putative extracellular nuclease n=1 Tax=Marinicella litoralis TaxID=644220 RepID=A0A4R6XPP3_9GAMM|nr:ExeM/NucH family extracellular endonuclease [Marinicella litoralis]TDR19303.1 putative extracellular nuclease [Marinicella litoralis]